MLVVILLGLLAITSALKYLGEIDIVPRRTNY